MDESLRGLNPVIAHLSKSSDNFPASSRSPDHFSCLLSPFHLRSTLLSLPCGPRTVHIHNMSWFFSKCLRNCFKTLQWGSSKTADACTCHSQTSIICGGHCACTASLFAWQYYSPASSFLTLRNFWGDIFRHLSVAMTHSCIVSKNVEGCVAVNTFLCDVF